MQSKYATKELALLFDKPIQTILNWAENEKWSGEKRKGRGGGMVWYVCTMPEARRVNLQLRHSCRSAVEDYGKQSREAVNRKARAQALVNVSETASTWSVLQRYLPNDGNGTDFLKLVSCQN